ncbi:MAG: DUF6480 family protein [Mycobacterium sp.]
MSSEYNATPPPPDPPNLSPKGKWGVAPSSSPQLTRRSGEFPPARWPWWLLVVVIVVVIVALIVWVL